MIKKKIKADYPFYKIVADGGMSASSIGEGRFIPAVVIDIGDNNEIKELIELHRGMPPGDTSLQWSVPDTWFSIKSVFLNLKFLKPMNAKFGIEFDLSKQYSLVDGIIHSRAFYLLSGKKGDKVSQNIKESILIEVPNLDFDKAWNELLLKTLKKSYKNSGAPKKEIQQLVSSHVKTMRDIWSIRRPD